MSEELFNAIEENDINRVRELIAAGADVNKTDKYGYTAFDKSIEIGDINIIRLIVKSGANINRKDTLGYTAFDDAIQMGKEDIARLLVESGFNINGTYMKGTTRLLTAVRSNNQYLVKLLVELGANINQIDNYGKTPIFYATNNTSMIILLVELGANINQIDNYGKTPLEYAVSSGKIDIVRLLVKELGADINKENKYGSQKTPLEIALSYYDNLDMVGFLVKELGADINKENKYGQTPLEIAVSKGKIDMVRFLVKELGADINKENKYGRQTPLEIAVSSDNLDMVLLLVELGADVNKKNKYGKAPYLYARCYPEILEILKEAGAIVENFEENQLLYLTHVTNLNNFSKILESGKIYSNVDMWYKNAMSEGLTPGAWVPSSISEQYPGVYMTLINNELVGQEIRLLEDYGPICLVFCISLLNREDFHYNDEDSSGSITSRTSFNVSGIESAIENKCITKRNEVIFHHSVSLKYLKEIWVYDNKTYSEVKDMLKKNSMDIPVEITNQYLNLPRTCDKTIKKLSTNYCYFSYGIDEIELIKKIGKECGLTDIDDIDDLYELSELLEKPIFSDDITIEGIKEYLKSKGVSEDTIENLSESQLKELKDMNLVGLNFLKNYSRFDGGKGRKSGGKRRKSRSKRKKSVGRKKSRSRRRKSANRKSRSKRTRKSGTKKKSKSKRRKSGRK